jgi:hypothetical protein
MEELILPQNFTRGRLIPVFWAVFEQNIVTRHYHPVIYRPLKITGTIFFRIFDMFYEETMQTRARRAFRRFFKKPFTIVIILAPCPTIQLQIHYNVL